MKNIRKYLFIIVVIQLLILLIIRGFTYARYVSNSVFNYYLKSKSFYFTSDYLSMNTTRNVNNMWDGESTHFSIKNSINQGAVSEADIDYTVTCSLGDLASNIDCYIHNGESSGSLNTYNGTLSVFKSCINTTEDGVDTSSLDETDCEIGGYTWKNHAMEADLYFDLIPKNGYEISDVIANISVTSTAPYSKTLNGEFIIHKGEIITGEIDSIYENLSSYDRLTITNSYLQDKCVSVSFNSDDLRIDSLSSEFSSFTTDSNGYINEIKFIIPSQRNKSYIFYKTNVDIHNLDDFVILESKGC